MTDRTLIGLHPASLPDAWHDLRGHVELACQGSNGKYEAVDVLRLLISTNMQIWASIVGDKPEAIAITELVNYPRKRIARIMACVGKDADKLAEHLPAIERWAKEQNGCAALEAIVRPGWEKIMKPSGYVKSHVIVEKVL